MAKAAAAAQTDAPPKGGPSLIVQLMVLLLLTGVAVGMGWFSGTMLSGEQPAAEAPQEHAEPAKDEGDEKPGPPRQANLIDIEPITTNLAAPSTTWVRMELTLVFAAEPEPALAETIHQDLLAYMRTVKLHQIEGASGFQHLKTDLEERASLRSEGKVTRILVRTLLFE